MNKFDQVVDVAMSILITTVCVCGTTLVVAGSSILLYKLVGIL